MLFIKQLLSSSNLTNETLTKPAIACVNTTRPIYLVFGEDYSYPTYVIRKLSEERDFEIHQVHVYLYRLVGRLVPQPLGICEYSGDKYEIQQGVRGAPWFQIKTKYRNAKECKKLEQRLWQTLKSFQAKIVSDGSNVVALHPDIELRKVYDQYKAIELKHDSKLEKLVDLAAIDLKAVRTCNSISQHGDFCLNNVIIDLSHITVIDFEDFGITKMPLYDHFTLALSLPSSSSEPHQAVSIFNARQIVDYANQLNISENTLKWHFLHHILLRLGAWSCGEKRKRYRAWLNQLLNNFVANHIEITANRHS